MCIYSDWIIGDAKLELKKKLLRKSRTNQVDKLSICFSQRFCVWLLIFILYTFFYFPNSRVHFLRLCISFVYYSFLFCFVFIFVVGCVTLLIGCQIQNNITPIESFCDFYDSCSIKSQIKYKCVCVCVDLSMLFSIKNM